MLNSIVGARTRWEHARAEEKTANATKAAAAAAERMKKEKLKLLEAEKKRVDLEAAAKKRKFDDEIGAVLSVQPAKLAHYRRQRSPRSDGFDFRACLFSY